MRRDIKTRLHFFLAVWLVALPAYAQTNLRPLQEQAEAALVAGQPEETVRITAEILKAQPDSFTALYLQALAQADLDMLPEAARTGARAYAAALTEDDRYQAARFTAGVRFRAGQYTRSEFWLRRAANHAPSQEAFDDILRAYRTSVEANPLAVRVSGFIAPSDNINNGSDEGILQLEGIGLTFVLPEDRRSLSGVAFAASTDLQYRIAQSPRQSTYVTGSLTGETFALSSEARDLLDSSPNPAIRVLDGSDFATVVATVGLSRQQNNLSPLGPVRMEVDFGTYWEGGERLINFRDLELEQIMPLNAQSTLRIGGALRDQYALLPTLLDTTTHEVNLRYLRHLANDDQIDLSIGALTKDAGFENSFDEYQVAVGYGLGQPVLGVQLYTSLTLGYRDYAEFTTTLDGRRDRFFTAIASATFEEISYFGFSPSISVSASRTVSSAEENTSSELQLLFGISSNF